MLRRFIITVSLLFLGSVCAPLFAQTTTLPACLSGLDQATVGVPYYCDYGTALNQYFAQFLEMDTGVSITFTFAVTSGSTLPPGMSLTPSGVFSGTPTTSGSFNFSIDITFNISVPGQNFSETVPFPNILQVSGTLSGTTLVSPSGLVFAWNQGTTTSSQSISLTSRSSQTITYTATATTVTGSPWLTVSPSGSLGPFQSAAVIVTVNGAGLTPGAHSGAIALTLSSGENFTIPVLLTVSSNQQTLWLSQTGLLFQAVQGGTSPPSQSMSVLNGGGGSLNFSASATVLSGGTWLSVTPGSGTASGGSSGASVSVSVNSKGLAPGNYYGSVQFSAPNVPNSPQTTSVVLTVASPAQSPGPSLSATGVIFVAQAGSTVNAQTITVSNPSPNPLSYSSAAFSDNNTGFYTVSPANGTVTSGQPLTISVQPKAGLATGIYTGNVTLVFADATTQTIYQRRVAIVLIAVSSLPSVEVGGLAKLAPRAVCAPTKLIPVATQLGDSFNVPTSWPVPLQVIVVDDCGTFVNQGTVVSTFSTGDAPLALTALGNGQWGATWTPHQASSHVTVTIQAAEASPAISGSVQLGGVALANASVPAIDSGGVVSAASNTVMQPLAPGSYVSVYGKNLGSGSFIAPSLPLQGQLGGTQVIMGGKSLPLNYVGNGQINAVVPFDIPVNAMQQVIVQANGALSVPQPVLLSTAQPAIFTQDQSGHGLGVIVDYKPDGTAPFLVDHSHAASAGDVLVIYCTGLGPVDQAVTAGNAGPSSPPANVVNPVTATVGGQNANVAFAGLAPQLTVYQINLVVPAGVTAGSDVPVVLTQAGLQSVPVTVSIK
ncbi:MAG TPA: hypothetical protein VKB79_08145 [Bryobacteraceae bacterium]|nr:hypothetical protein [Bryobacteraceae bacterium]